MKAFHCDRCGSLVFFENISCVKCGGALGFAPDLMDLITWDVPPDGALHPVSPSARDRTYRRCANSEKYDVCNWLVPRADGRELCRACRLNRTIPDLSISENLERWRKMEAAKRRVVYTLLHLNLLDESNNSDETKPPLRFDFLGETPGGQKILTGHANGIITVNIAEADDAERERLRVELGERYRTVLGHFRHEIGHYYWDHLIDGSSWLDEFRKLFGDERQNYAESLQHYYKCGPTPDWRVGYVTAYASAHPWEDWAETWAHYLHIVDTVETASSFGMSLKPKQHPDGKAMTSNPAALLEIEASFDKLLKHWLPITYAINSLNRGMGLPDLYPFVLSIPAIEKLRFIHERVVR
jgi:hypothetical protein